MTEAPIEILPYDPAWPARFEAERQAIAVALATWIVGRIEHVGSTAIHGLAAKPVIDIMAGVQSLDASRAAIDAATGLGYCYFPYRPDSEHWFCKPSPAFRTHHLHLVPFGNGRWRGTIAFRDYLRQHPAIAVEYEMLKRQLAREFHLDREAYTRAKHPFIERITNCALEAGYGDVR
jgi:GrpB-like predicted nucleotidyltransferase (UPF0157 family)